MNAGVIARIRSCACHFFIFFYGLKLGAHGTFVSLHADFGDNARVRMPVTDSIARHVHGVRQSIKILRFQFFETTIA